jgi:hypothetical protein
MIIKIAKSERSAIEKGVAIADLKVLFYSNETTEGMLTAEILDAFGEEPSNTMAFYLARQIEAQVEVDNFINRK